MLVKNIILSIIASTLIVGCSSTDTKSNKKNEVLVSNHSIDRDFEGTVEDLLEEEHLIRNVEIYFDTGSSVIPEQYAGILNDVKRALSHDPKLKLYIQGHADKTGESNYNIELSKERAWKIIKEMKLNKDTYKRISIDFFGEDKPRCDVDSKEGLSCNRRVDIFLVK
jgi:outer membrane protein OmpA-like peptidoglycan-associated protein